MRILFDMSSVMWTALYAGTDKEFGRKVEFEGRQVQVNGAEHGYENAVNHMVHVLKRYNAVPRDMILVFEGANSKALRLSLYNDYKASRGGRPEESYVEFNRLKEMLRQTFRDLGAIAVHQDGIEADDVLGYFAKNLTEPHVICTNDGDMCVLVGGNTTVLRADVENENPYGPFPHRFITLYKAVVGDDRDNIKGAKGFGPKAWLDLLCLFGEEGLAALEWMVLGRKLDALSEDVADLKVLQKIIDNAEMVYTSWDLARLYPEKVNTMRKPLQWAPGMPIQRPAKADQRLAHWYGQNRLVHAGNYAQMMGWLQRALPSSPIVALDIETSTPPESDDWMEARSKGKASEEGSSKVDVFGSKLTGMSLTLGDNCQHTVYLTVDHVPTQTEKNITSAQACSAVQLVPEGKKLVIQNLAFELPVLFQEWGEQMKDNGWHGFLPNCVDTKVMSAYVDENFSSGLKQNSEKYLGYKQVSYAEVTVGRKMNELTAQEAFAYGCDDTICTAALYNFYSLIMDLEGTRASYDAVEIEPAYLDAQRYVKGLHLSMEKLLELEAEDLKAQEDALDVLHSFLVSKGWEGAICPQFDAPLEPADVKLAYNIITRRELKTQVRKLDKLALLIKAQDAPAAEQIAHFIERNYIESLNSLVKLHFIPDRSINFNSPAQVSTLLYETVGLPVRLRNPVTAEMRKQGIKLGNPQTDDLAIEYALKYDAENFAAEMPILKAVKTIKMTSTRQKLYYEPYKRGVLHWKDALVHAYFHQSAAATLRYASSDPNLQQLPKHPKNGVPAKFRQVVVPHKKRAVVISLDYNAQELRNIAEQSQDPNMLSCYVGENKKNMHALTGHSILLKKDAKSLGRMIDMIEVPHDLQVRWSNMEYADFTAANGDKGNLDHALVKQCYAIGKKVNFTTEYGAQAPKLAKTLIVSEDEAQVYIAARHAQFPRAEEWKKEVISDLHRFGFVTNMLGARRHLAEAFRSDDKWEVSKAERQAVNYKIQSSCAGQTKQGMKYVWKWGLTFKYDAQFIGPIHDELVFSCAVEDVLPFIEELSKAMTMPFANMKVPIVASISLGANFGEQIECGDEYDEKGICAALKKLGYTEKDYLPQEKLAA